MAIRHNLICCYLTSDQAERQGLWACFFRSPFDNLHFEVVIYSRKSKSSSSDQKMEKKYIIFEGTARQSMNHVYDLALGYGDKVAAKQGFWIKSAFTLLTQSLSVPGIDVLFS